MSQLCHASRAVIVGELAHCPEQLSGGRSDSWANGIRCRQGDKQGPAAPPSDELTADPNSRKGATRSCKRSFVEARSSPTNSSTSIAAARPAHRLGRRERRTQDPARERPGDSGFPQPILTSRAREAAPAIGGPPTRGNDESVHQSIRGNRNGAGELCQSLRSSFQFDCSLRAPTVLKNVRSFSLSWSVRER